MFVDTWGDKRDQTGCKQRHTHQHHQKENLQQRAQLATH